MARRKSLESGPSDFSHPFDDKRNLDRLMLLEDAYMQRLATPEVIGELCHVYSTLV